MWKSKKWGWDLPWGQALLGMHVEETLGSSSAPPGKQVRQLTGKTNHDGRALAILRGGNLNDQRTSELDVISEKTLEKKESPLGYINSFWRQMILKEEGIVATGRAGSCVGAAMEVLTVLKQS